jgi:hypothetical protein
VLKAYGPDGYAWHEGQWDHGKPSGDPGRRKPVTAQEVSKKVVGGDVPQSLIDSIVAIANSDNCVAAFKMHGLKSPLEVVRRDDFKAAGRGVLTQGNAGQLLGWTQKRVNDSRARFDKDIGVLGLFWVKYTADISYKGTNSVVFNASVLNKLPEFNPRDVATHAFIHLGGQPGDPNAKGHDLSTFKPYNEILKACR